MIVIANRDHEKYLIIDIDKKEVIRNVQWANDKTGEYEIIVRDDKGTIARGFSVVSQHNEPIIINKKGNILIVKSNGITTLQK